jgi:rhodanese-related sulfurtransferase
MPLRRSRSAPASTVGLQAAIRLIVVTILASVAFAACGADDDPATATVQPASEPSAGFENLDPDTLAEMLSAKDFPLINVHIPYEGEIEPTDLFITYNEIEQHLDQLPADKDARIVLYCRSGSMSATASQTLVDLGYTNVAHLDGGMIAWEEAGYPLVMREGSVASTGP